MYFDIFQKIFKIETTISRKGAFEFIFEQFPNGKYKKTNLTLI